MLDNPNRYRVSRKLTILKIVVYVALGLLGYNLILTLSNGTITSVSMLGFISLIILFSFFLYYLNTRRTIEYDDIKHILYVLHPEGTIEFEVPVEKIDEILFLSMGVNNLGSYYLIIFRDFHDQKRRVRFYTIPFRKDINTIIIDTKLKNPNLITRNWSIG